MRASEESRRRIADLGGGKACVCAKTTDSGSDGSKHLAAEAQEDRERVMENDFLVGEDTRERVKVADVTAQHTRFEKVVTSQDHAEKQERVRERSQNVSLRICLNECT